MNRTLREIWRAVRRRWVDAWNRLDQPFANEGLYL